MRHFTFIFIFILSVGTCFSQGNSVGTADQFCSGGSELVFPNVTGSSDFTPVGCLGSIPNAAYYYLTVDQPGDLIFTISQEDTFGDPIDVDFIAWGPFVSIAAADAAITLTDCPTCPNNTFDATFYPYAPDFITDCSYDSAPTETLTINGASTGEIYVVLITNFDGAAGNISIQQTNGMGTTSCADLPVCGGTFLDSGGDTGSYSNNETNTTIIYPFAAGGTASITFTDFDLASGDNLTIYNGPNDTYPLLGSFSGTTLPGTFTSTDATGTLTFVFISNNTNVGDGWEANVSCTNPPPPPTCGTNFYDTGGITGTYLNNESRATTIFPPVPGGTVTVDFTVFNILPGDVLTVYDGPNDTFTSLGNVLAAPSSFTSTNPAGALTFVFTSNSSGLSSGWEANVSCTTPPTCSSFFYDSGGATGNYSNNENQPTTFFPDTAGDAVTVTFTQFDLEFADDLYVYDGPDATSPLLGVFNGTALPGPFTSSHTTGALTFVFESDFSVTYAGWEASLSCAPYVPPVICGSTFTDSGGASGNYTNSENQITTLIPDNLGQIITATFTAFRTENNLDILRIYDGPNNSFPLLGAFSGTANPGSFTSTHPTGALTFAFTSDSSLTYAGWSADITCTTLCDDYIISTTDGESCGEGTVNLSATATSGATAFYWYTTASGGTQIATTPTGSWTTPTITNTTTYYVSVYNGICESDRVPVVANILPEPTDVTISTILTPLGATDCNLQYAELTASGGEFSNSVNQIVLDQDFESGLTDCISGAWTTVNNSTGGTPANAAWTIRPDSYAAFIYTFNSNDNSNFILSDSDDQGSGSNTNTELISPVYSLEFFTSASISYYYHYNDFGSTDNAQVEISTDGGTTWETATPLRQYTTDQGDSDNFIQDTIDLAAYLGQTTLQIRFKYTAAWDIFWAIDNIILEGERNTPSSTITWAPTNGLFTDASLTTPYNGDPATTVYAAPNGTQMYTVTAEGYNGCTKTDTVTISRNGKIWNGSQSTDWYDVDNWTPTGIPTNQNCVVIPDVATTNNNSPIVIGGAPIPPPPGLGRSLRVEDDGYMELLQFSNLIITDAIDVEPDGKVILRNGSNLIQITNTGITNSGDIQMQRTVTSLNPQDYVYWSSPVNNFGVTNVSPSSNLIYNWIPTITGNGAGNYGNWQATTEIMQPGKGYIIRGVAGTNPETAPATNTVEFRGVPRNGTYQIPIMHGNYAGGNYTGAGNTMATELDDNWNLIGNPYPSAISADAFIAQNASFLDDSTDPNTPAVFGTVYLWRHQTAPSSITDPFYGDYVYNYNSNDYIGYNSTGSNPFGFNGNIGAGQAFFVLMDHNAPTPSNVTFNNSMRLDSGFAPYDNNEFYRGAEYANRNFLEKHRIWLDLIAPNNTANSILIGYVQNATNDVDRLFDGFELSETSNRFYSIINTEEMAIQGRTLPFNDEDIVPLGIEIATSGNYSIAINTLDGLFNDTNQTIFIEDTYTNIIHNVRISPYIFNTDYGIFNDRFILKYTDNSLSVDEYNANSSLTITAPNSNYIKVFSKINTIKSVYVYDMLGRELIQKLNINSQEIIIENTSFSEGAYIVKAITANNRIRIEKVILKR